MKLYSIPIGKWNSDWVFKPIRDKREEIIFLMKVVKILLVGQQLNAAQSIGEVCLVVKKMSRVFLFLSGKYISINFPFTVIERNGKPIFTSRFIDEVDSQVTSDILAVLAKPELFESDCVIAFADRISEYPSGFWGLLRHLLIHEDGYVRYDLDEANANGRRHPPHHYDVFYSSGATFKVGLNGSLTHEQMIDFLEITSDCHFLE